VLQCVDLGDVRCAKYEMTVGTHCCNTLQHIYTTVATHYCNTQGAVGLRFLLEYDVGIGENSQKSEDYQICYIKRLWRLFLCIFGLSQRAAAYQRGCCNTLLQHIGDVRCAKYEMSVATHH